METGVTDVKKKKIGIHSLVKIGMLAGIAVVLMLFEIPLPFLPAFYEIDISEVPVLLGCFAMGPLAGVLIELVKILLNLVLNGTATGGVGEFANFLIGCAFCVPAGVIYQKMKSKKGAVIGMVTGTTVMTVLGCFLNALVLLPLYAKLFGMPIDAIVAMGTSINPRIQSLTGFVMLAVVPFNLLKGVVVSVLVFLLYKKLSPILHKYSDIER